MQAVIFFIPGQATCMSEWIKFLNPAVASFLASKLTASF